MRYFMCICAAVSVLADLGLQEGAIEGRDLQRTLAYIDALNRFEMTS